MSTKTATDNSLRVPPEEQFWKRYSPHGEAPLSMAGSFGLHLAIGGGLLLLGMFILTNFGNSRTSLPVEPVRLKFEGGGGGKQSGDGDGKGVTTGEPFLMSMTIAPFELPPICRMRPGLNMAGEPEKLAYCEENWPAGVMLPLPARLT